MSNGQQKKTSSTSRSRRKVAREKANAGYSDRAHPRSALADSVDLERIRGRLEPVVEQFDLVLEDITARGAGNGQTLSVVVDLAEDKEGSVALDTIAEVSRALSAALDEADDEPESEYLLEVSSPGATRKLTEPRHWKRSRGRLVRIVTARANFLARLEETDGSTATIRRKRDTPKGVPEKYEESERLDLGDVQKAHVEVEFNQ
ncbi:ribosome maturation factor RimP [Rothia sp. AR01]|uniref:Ribosome maturation factor RimP n=1 Tax=Rothia santali TaxID=2949643 RepID=A0A9X2KHM5_9MICC|nr:ribosome maturation factor RimP [Rothia santali]MCP3425065.1 ribosome maturation factor RimP [Rothia santali]